MVHDGSAGNGSGYREIALVVSVLAGAALVALAVWAADAGRLPAAQAVLLVVLGALAVASFGMFIHSLGGGDGVGVESHWGGIGGGVGGWRVTTPLIFLLLTIFFAGLLTASVQFADPPAQPPADPPAEETGS